MGEEMKLILASLVHNDFSKGWLSKWLDTNHQFCDAWVIVDDCSDDDTYQYIQQTNYENIHLHRMEEPTFKTNENKIRQFLWDKVKEIAEEGDVILVLDSDELLTDDFKNFREMVKQVRFNNPQFIFKKIELWNEEEYRVDGLWSNYFNRAFIFKNKDWGYSGEGFHYPQIPKYVFVSGEFVNTDLRIKHLAYSTSELRKEKYDFMMNNPQQKKDITYYHLQTTMDEHPVLKKFEQEIKWPELNIVLICNNTYKLDKRTLECLENHNYKGKVNLYAYINNSNIKLINKILELDLKVEKFVVDIKNYEEDFINKIPNKNAVLKREAFKALGFEDDSWIIFIDGYKAVTPALLKHIITTDKEVVLERMFLNIFGVTGKVFNLLKNNYDYMYDGEHHNFNFLMSEKLKGRGFKTWGIIGGAPFPIN
jgi:glycosyltransferase involved in cell wall biosynthesis